jgi:hypothetical protein
VQVFSGVRVSTKKGAKAGMPTSTGFCAKQGQGCCGFRHRQEAMPRRRAHLPRVRSGKTRGAEEEGRRCLRHVPTKICVLFAVSVHTCTPIPSVFLTGSAPQSLDFIVYDLSIVSSPSRFWESF